VAGTTAPPVETPAKAPHWQRPHCVADVDPYAPDSHAVYRFFNVPGALLYVGISANPKVRFGQHSHNKGWWPEVARWQVEWFASKADAEAEEARAIVDEMPAFNLLGAPEPGQKRDVKTEWMTRFRQQRPTRDDLDALFLAIARGRSIKGCWPRPRQLWDPDEALDVYVYAKDQATPRDVHDHQRWIETWNVEQEGAWRKHHGEPSPEMVPVWRRKDSVQVRIGAWLLGRSSRREARRALSAPDPR
jgi:hypothetical protein